MHCDGALWREGSDRSDCYSKEKDCIEALVYSGTAMLVLL